MKQFLRSLYIFIRLYKMGYVWSGLYDLHGGFYRLNYLKNGQEDYGILDVDFQDKVFSHIHGGRDNATIFRVDKDKVTYPSGWFFKKENDD